MFNTDFLHEQLGLEARNRATSHDSGRDIIPSLIGHSNVVACRVNDEKTGTQPYWQDLGTLDAYRPANMGLRDTAPRPDLCNDNRPVLACQSQLPSAKFCCQEPGSQRIVQDSVISAGCSISGSHASRSILSSGVKVRFLARPEQTAFLPEVDIGRRCRIKRAIIDRDCPIPAGTVIRENPASDAKRYRITGDGVVLVRARCLARDFNSWREHEADPEPTVIQHRHRRHTLSTNYNRIMPS